VVEWNGSVSTDWNTAANWTVLQGVGSTPPGANDIVNLGTATFTYHPTINTNVTVKNINFGSAQALTLSMASGGTLTAGTVAGSWSSNKTHQIAVNNQTVNINGDLELSDGTTGHAIDIGIASGTLNITGTLTQSGGAAIVFSAAGLLDIDNDFIYTAGTFTAGSGTVTYSGTNNQVVGAVSYNHLTVNKAAGLASITSDAAVLGDLSILAGELDNAATIDIEGDVTISSGAILYNQGVLEVGGDWNNSGSYSSNTAGTNVVFDGSGTQTISSTTFDNLEFNKPVGSLAELTGDVTLTGNLVGTSGSLDIKSYFFNRDVAGGSATMLNNATLIVGADNAPTRFANYYMSVGSTVIFNGTSTQHLLLPGLVYGNLVFRNSGNKILYSATTIAGNLTIESGASFDAGANTISLGGNWVNNGTFTPATSTLLFTGTSKTLTGVSTFNNITVTGSYTILSNVTVDGLLNITSTGALYGGGSLLVTMNGDLTNRGTLYTLGTTTFTGNVVQTMSLINAVQTVALTVNFNGTVSPVLNSTSVPQFGYLNINNTGGVNPSVGWTVLYALNIGSGASFGGGASTHNILGAFTNNGTVTSSGILNFIPSSAVTLNMGSNFSSTGTVVFGGSGAITLSGSPTALHNVTISNSNAAGVTPSSAWSMDNDFLVSTGAVWHASSYTHTIGGDIVSSGTINANTSTIVLNGTTSQDINCTAAFNKLTINKAAGAVTLSSNITINDTLTFTAGLIETGAYAVIVPAAGVIAGAAQNTGWVNGQLTRGVGTGAITKLFDVGDDAIYTPLSIAFASVSVAGSLTASSTAGDHPALANSTISASKSVNRYYTLTNSGIQFDTYTANFSFDAADIDAGATASNFGVANYSGSSWLVPAFDNAAATSIDAVDLAAFGDFAIGEICNHGTSISYADVTYCAGDGTAAVTIAGSLGGVFAAGPGLTIDASTGAIDLNNSTPGTYTVTYTIAASGDCGEYITSFAVTVGSPGAWTGAVSSAWNNAANWSCNGIPSETANITIPSGLSNYPVISGTATLNNITIQDGAAVTVTGTLQIAGVIYNSGTLTATSGTIEMNGVAAQEIPADVFAGNTINNLIVSNNTTLMGELLIKGAVRFGNNNDTLTTGDYLVLLSTASGTARLADITNAGANSGNALSGKVTIERYIPARRAWRLLSAPVSSTDAPTINSAWQEGSITGDPAPGYGTHITGGTEDNGFDIGINSNPSLKIFDNGSGSYTGLPVVPGTMVDITSYPGYFLFIRGGRSTNLGLGVNAPASATTLRITGNVNTNDVAAAVNASGFTLLGNPYPSAINFHSLTKSNVNDKLYIWDPKMAGTNGLGGYVTLLWNGSGYDATTAVSAVSHHIQSGEAFLVESSNGQAGTLTFKETDKSTGGSDNVFRPISGRETMRIDLYGLNADGALALHDGVLTTYADNNNASVDANDARKLYNTSENLCINRDGQQLAIERRPTITGADTSLLKIYGLKQKTYQLRINIQSMANSGLYAVLKDNYAASINNTPLNLAGVTQINFTTNTDPRSYANDRFSVVFEKVNTVLPVTFTRVNAAAENNTLQVSWQTAHAQDVVAYQVERAVNGIDFLPMGTAIIAGGSSYRYVDSAVNAGWYQYRIKAIFSNGGFAYSTIVKAMLPAAHASISIYPNPVTGAVVKLHFTNQPAGEYQVRIVNNSGQVITKAILNHRGSSSVQNVTVPAHLPPGMYTAEVISAGRTINSVPLMIQ
jgi:hypothetical protein